MAEEIDEDFDFSEELSIQPPLPSGLLEAGEIVISGMSPAGIKDPQLRAEYEKLIVEHSRKME